jgi:hypothetical protein
MLEPTSLAEQRATGNYWKRTYIGPHLPEVRRLSVFWERALAEPELWHPDDIEWRRRSELRHLMDRATAGEDPRGAVVADAPELSVDDVDFFFDQLVPLIQRAAPDRSTWDRLPDVVVGVRSICDEQKLFVAERILGRLTVLLNARLEPLFFQEAKLGKLELPTYFHLTMLAHQILLGGRAIYEEIYRRPELAVGMAEGLGIASGCYLMGIFQYDGLIFQAQKRRLVTRFVSPARVAPPNPRAKRHEEQVMDGLNRLSAAMELAVFLEGQFRGERFERGQPERYPTFELQVTGEVIVRPFDSDAEADRTGEIAATRSSA